MRRSQSFRKLWNLCIVQLCKCEIEIAAKLFKNKFIIYYIICII